MFPSMNTLTRRSLTPYTTVISALQQSKRHETCRKINTELGNKFSVLQ